MSDHRSTTDHIGTFPQQTEILNLTNSAQHSGCSAYEFQSVSRELQIHQIELEAQNRALNETINNLNLQIEELKAAKAELRLQGDIMNIMSEGVVHIQIETGTILFANPRFERLFGYDPSELTGKNVSILNAPGDIAAEEVRNSIIGELIKTGEWHGEVENIRKDGARFWGSVHAVILDSQKYGRTIVSVQTDITERRKIESTLLKNEELFRSIANLSPDIISIIAPDGTLLYNSPAALTLHGYTDDDMLGINTIELIHPDDRAMITSALNEIFTTPFQNKTVQYRYKNKDGSYTWMECSATNQISNPAIQGLVAISRSIEERKLAENRLYQANEFIAYAQKAGGSGFWSWVVGTDRLNWSPELFQLFGLAPSEDGSTAFYTWQNLVHPEDLPTAESNIAMALRDHIPFFNEYRIVRPSGEIKWINAFGDTVYDELGQPLSMSGICVDITGRKKIEAEKSVLEQQFQQSQKLESLGIMAGGIAHDFNNILQTLLGNIEIVARDIAPGTETYTHISNAIIAGRQATHLINLMLAYAGKGTIIKKQLNLNEMLNENIDILRSAATSAVTIDMHLSDKLPDITADISQLQQVILNLITNAAESIEHLPGIITITTGTADYDKQLLSKSLLDAKPEPGRFVVLEVNDNGCGMSKDTITHIFEPFFTTKFTGHGLGMSAVMGIVRSHGGAIFVTSEVGKGTTFKVLLPESVAVTSDNVQQAVSGRESFATPSGISHVFTVLLVDDEKNVLRTCSKMVSLCGYNVITACDGVDAVRKYREQTDEIDAVLMDLTMPNMDGITAMNEIRMINPAARIMLASGFNKEELGGTITGSMPTGFIRKPYSMSELEAELKKFFQ